MLNRQALRSVVVAVGAAIGSTGHAAPNSDLDPDPTVPRFTTHEFRIATPAVFGHLSGVPADLDGDGRPEVIADGFDDRIYVYRLDGHRAGAPRVLPIAPGSGFELPPWIGVADVDRDGDPDVVTFNDGSHLELLRNDAGELTSVGTVDVGAALGVRGFWVGNPWASARILDAEEPGSGVSPSVMMATDDGIVQVTLGGTHGFGAVALVDPRPGFTLDAGDLDGDGRDDIVWSAGLVDPGTYRTLRTPQAGWGPSEIVTTARAWDLDLADLDGDGQTDLLVTDAFGGPLLPRELTILPGDGRGGFTAPHRLDVVPDTRVRSSVGDIDGDGLTDVMSMQHTGDEGDLRMRIYRGRPGGFPERWIDDVQTTAVFETAITDVTGDGVDDLVLPDGGGIVVVAGRRGAPPGNGSMLFVEAVFERPSLVLSSAEHEPATIAYTPAPGGTIVLATLDGQDLIRRARTVPVESILGGEMLVAALPARSSHLLVRTEFVGPDLQIVVRRRTNLEIETTQILPSDGFDDRFAGLGDVNGDGMVDLVWVEATGPDLVVSLRPGVSGDRFGAPVADADVPRLPTPMTRAFLHDLDGDGALDIVIGHRVGVLVGWGTGTGVWETFTNAVDVPDALPMTRPFAGDLNGDGLDDLVLERLGLTNVFTQIAPREFEFVSEVGDPADESQGHNRPFDVDGDGDLDLVREKQWFALEWLENRSTPEAIVFGRRRDGTLVEPLSDIRIADLDGDGRAELLSATETRRVMRAQDPVPTNRRDVDADGVVGLHDLIAVLGAWGTADVRASYAVDVDRDGVVGLGDLLAVLASWPEGGDGGR